VREPEFLPAWYPQLRRRKRLVALQGWMTLVLICGLGLWFVLVQRNVRASELQLQSLGGQMAQTQLELARLDDMLELQKQLKQQDEVIAKLGLHVDSARLLATLKEVIPAEMSLLDTSLTIEEKPLPVSSLSKAAAAGGTKAKGEPEPKVREVDRRMKVKLQGVAPSDVDLATFLARLQAMSYLQQVAVSYARDRTDNEHVMREFEVTFSIDLNDSDTNPTR